MFGSYPPANIASRPWWISIADLLNRPTSTTVAAGANTATSRLVLPLILQGSNESILSNLELFRTNLLVLSMRMADQRVMGVEIPLKWRDMLDAIGNPPRRTHDDPTPPNSSSLSETRWQNHIGSLTSLQDRSDQTIETPPFRETGLRRVARRT